MCEMAEIRYERETTGNHDFQECGGRLENSNVAIQARVRRSGCAILKSPAMSKVSVMLRPDIRSRTARRLGLKFVSQVYEIHKNIPIQIIVPAKASLCVITTISWADLFETWMFSSMRSASANDVPSDKRSSSIMEQRHAIASPQRKSAQLPHQLVNG